MPSYQKLYHYQYILEGISEIEAILMNTHNVFLGKKKEKYLSITPSYLGLWTTTSIYLKGFH